MKDKETIIHNPYGFIYITTNMVNGKRYLGQKKFNNGWETYLGSGYAFKKAVKKYGKESFVRDIVHICYSQNELNEVEYQLSVFLNVVESDDWYNLCLGGDVPTGISEEVREKMRQIAKKRLSIPENNPMYGKTQTEEAKAKISAKAKDRLSDKTNHPMYGKPGLCGEDNPMYGISPKERMDEKTYKQWYEAHLEVWSTPWSKGKHIWSDKQHPCLGKKLTDEQKRKISENAKQRYFNKEMHPMYGKKHTEESRNKMSEKRSNGQMYCCKPIYCPELNQYFYSASEVEQIYGISASAIRKYCRDDENRKSAGKHPETGEPLHWMDVTKEEYELFVNKNKGEL